MVFIATRTIAQFIHTLIATNADLALREFTQRLHDEFYSEIDISFMDQFLELSEEANEGQFIVPHQKLVEYGIATSSRSSNIGDRLTSLGLIKDQDYRLLVSQQPVKQGGFTTSNKYMH